MVLYCLDFVDSVGTRACHRDERVSILGSSMDIAGGLVMQSGVPFVRDNNGEERGTLVANRGLPNLG